MADHSLAPFSPWTTWNFSVELPQLITRIFIEAARRRSGLGHRYDTFSMSEAPEVVRGKSAGSER